MMKERPILFNGEMVRAILDGRKTMTRRAINPQPEMELDGEVMPDGSGGCAWEPALPPWSKWPYGLPGDRLWVRETWRECDDDELGACIRYRADGARIKPVFPTPNDGWKTEQNAMVPGWRPSIHMPRWACRILLDVVSVRVERLQDISRADAIAEGAPARFHAGVDREFGAAISIAWFAKLWESTYAKRGLGWDANPWVWVIEFTRAEATA